jgi:hypothetical protein
LNFFVSFFSYGTVKGIKLRTTFIKILFLIL